MSAELEMTQWCNEHDLPMRTIRTADDRIVCWFIWWREAMEQSIPIEDRFPYDPPQPCDLSYRVVLAQGFIKEANEAKAR